MTIFVFLHLIWKSLYILHLPPTKPLYLVNYTGYGPKTLLGYVKLNYIKCQKSAGLWPAPIFHYFIFLPWGEILPLPTRNRVKTKISRYLIKLALKLFDALIKPILLYGAEVWGPYTNFDYNKWEGSNVEMTYTGTWTTKSISKVATCMTG